MSSGYNAKSSLKELKLVAVALMMDMAMDMISKVQTSQKIPKEPNSDQFLYLLRLNSLVFTFCMCCS